MSLKRFLTLGIAGLTMIAISAFGGGIVEAPHPYDVPLPIIENGLYLEAQLGYGILDWKDNFDLETDDILFTGSPEGGFVVGGDFGYQWNRFIATEVGGFYFPQVPGRFFKNGVIKVPFRLRSWAFYAAIKLMAPILENFNAYFKGGIAYRSISGLPEESPLFFSDTNTSIRPLAAVGLEYLWYTAWTVNLQYTYIASVNNIRAPAAHLFTASIGYFFAL